MPEQPAFEIDRATEGIDELPGFVAPELATLVDAVPEGDDWLQR